MRGLGGFAFFGDRGPNYRKEEVLGFTFLRGTLAVEGNVFYFIFGSVEDQGGGIEIGSTALQERYWISVFTKCR
jgi:hypothetical protein